MSVKVTGFRELDQKLARAIKDLADEKAIVDMGIEATQPMVQAVAAIVGTGSPWIESGLTRADIHARWDKESKPGVIKISIGASKKNAFKLRYLEFGTRKQRAYPALRPGYDSMIGSVMGGIVAGFRRIAHVLVG